MLKMLICWLTIAGLLVPSQAAAEAQPTVTLAPTYRVKGQPGAELTLNCGDQNNSTGVVKFWNTPFGAVHMAASVHDAHLEPVLLQQDGSLLLSNISSVHSGLYYCLLEEGRTRTLKPTVLNIGTRTRTRTSSVSDVPQSTYTAAIASSVLLSFLLGFSSGALSRVHVLRCLGSIAKRMRLPRRQQSNSDEPDRGVAMVTVPYSEMSPNPPTKPQRSFRHRSTHDAVEEMRTAAYLESCDHITTEERKEEESRTEEDENQEESLTEEEEEEESQTEEEKEEEDRLQEDKQTEEEEEKKKDWKKEEDQTEEEEERKQVENQTEEEEEKKTVWKQENNQTGEEKEEDRKQVENQTAEEEGGKQVEIQTKEEKKKDWKQEGNQTEEVKEEHVKQEENQTEVEKEENVKQEENQTEEEKKEDGKKEENQTEGEEEKEEDGKQEERNRKEEEEGNGKGEEEGTFSGFYLRGEEEGEVEDEEDTDSSSEEEPPGSEATPSGRRVIRLYQYDEDGRRYAHLPDPAPSDSEPAPRLKQRSLSLTRLNAIMAAASSSPLDSKQEVEPRPHFHMEI